MAEIGWLQLVGVAFGSGVTVKLLDIGYREVRRRLEGSRTATRFVDEHLDPLLKASDELVGKLQALSREDFRSFRMLNANSTVADNTELSGLIFLFARFWARIEIFKKEGLAVAISQDERGKRLEKFLDCLESTRVRLIDRTAQRAIGETLLEAHGDKLQTMTYIEFVSHAAEPEKARWLEPLRAILVRAWHTQQKQKLILFAIVLHALIDALDSKHLVTRKRPGVANKLSRQSWRNLNYRVFGVYLNFIKDRQKYLGPPK